MISVDLMSLWSFACSVLLCYSVRNRTHPLDEMIYMQIFGKFYLSQSAQSSLSIFAHSFEPTERLRHTEFTEAFQLRLAITFCDIGWLNVSVKLCVFCSSVFFCEKKNNCETRWVVPSLTKDISFSHRTHRFNRTHLRTVSNPQKASGIQNSQNVIAKDGCWVMGVRCWWLA